MDGSHIATRASVAGFILLCFCCGANADLRAQSLDGAWGPPVAPKPAAAPLQLDRMLSAAPLHMLSAAEEGARDQLAALRAWNAAGKRPMKIGFARQLAEIIEVRLAPSLAGRSVPEPLFGGSVADGAAGWLTWGTSVQVAGAHRLRLHLSTVSLPAGTRLFVAAPRGAAKAFGLELQAPNGDLWTPSVLGETLNFEVHVPVAALAARSGFDLRDVDEILDFTAGQRSTGTALRRQPAAAPLLDPRRAAGAMSPATSAEPFVAIPKDDSCLVDSSCETDANFNNIDTYRHAIAQIIFDCDVRGLPSVCYCTGSLLNDKAGDHKPYFLTANHCISDQTSASTIEATFDFYTSSCNGTPPDESTEPTANGSTLLAGHAADVTTGASDFTLLQLTDVPGGRYFLGWNANAVQLTDEPGGRYFLGSNANAGALAKGTPLYRLSHPFPNSASVPLPQAYTQYTNDPGFPIGCGLTGPNFLFEHATVGSTAGGSSGSPLMLANGQVVGQLYSACGTDLNNDCDTAQNDDLDGAFAASYPALAQYLDPATGPTPPCSANSTTLCIDNNPGDKRFEVKVSYQTSQGGGSSGNGNAISLSSLGITEGGVFWFFSATNPEMLI
jgi:hypothetical protein